MKNRNNLKVFSSSDLLAKTLAIEILSQLKHKKKFILGCPGGRSLTKTYYYLGRISYQKKINLKNLTIIMMDEYVIKEKRNIKLLIQHHILVVLDLVNK